MYRQHITSNGFFSCSPKWAKASFRVLLKDFEIKKGFFCSGLFLNHIKQIDSMLPCLCSVIHYRRRENVVRISVTHSVIASCAAFLVLPHFDVICDLLLNRGTATWNLFVKYSMPARDTPHTEVFEAFI